MLARMSRPLLLAATLAFAIAQRAAAHVGAHASVHDTVAGISLRMTRELPEDRLRSLTVAQVEAMLTAEEREVLGTEHVTFRVDVPVRVTVLHDARFSGDPFWLEGRGFRATGDKVVHGSDSFAAWEKDFPAGVVGLGVNSLRGGNHHYFVVLRPQDPGASVSVDQMYPAQLRTGVFEAGAQPYVDQSHALTNVPPALAGQTLIRTPYARRDAGKLVSLFRWTEHPPSDRPDHVVLTWSGDPRTTQAIQWRTGPGVRRGQVSVVKKSDHFRPSPRRPKRVRASGPEVLEDRYLVNSPRVHRFTAELTGLEPGTTYLYAVGDGTRDGWTEYAEFTTAPDGAVPFSFIYMGDAQNGLDRWGTLLANAQRSRPDAAFHLMAGDLVNRGAERDDWDSFFHNATGVFNRRPVVPVIGNHECQGGHPGLYLRHFALPGNGPDGVEKGRAYAFEYSNALFVVLDSNLPPETQTDWLERQLAGSRATWKFVSYHHPAYSSAPKRDNLKLRDAWTPLFDKHHVDLALQGHDHAYLRTYPMKGNARVGSAKEGTVYIVSVSGTKMYEQDPRDYTEFGLTNVPLYQVLDLQISGNRLVYRAYDIDGTLRDHFIIEK